MHNWDDGGIWRYWASDEEKKESPYKLHVRIESSQYDDKKNELSQLLQDAITDGTINTFKMVINYSYQRDGFLNRCQGNKKLIKQAERQFNNPVVIYIPSNLKMDALKKLCNSIETALKDASTKENSLSAADIPISPHLAFRRDSLFGIYISAGSAPTIILSFLRWVASLSSVFKGLTKDLNTGQGKANMDEPIVSSNGSDKSSIAMVKVFNLHDQSSSELPQVDQQPVAKHTKTNDAALKENKEHDSSENTGPTLHL